MIPHQRQFVLGPADVVSPLADGRSVVDLGDGASLLLGEGTRLRHARDADGEPWVVIGWALSPDGPVEEVLACTPTRDVAAVLHRFAGRFVAVGQDLLVQDASGLLGVHVMRVGEGVVTSSSTALLHQLAPDRTLVPLPRAQGRGGLYLSTVPMPGSRLAGVDALLATQLLRWRDGQVAPRPLLPDDPVDADPLDAIGDRLVGTLRALEREVDGTIQLALTGGHDSRLWLAAAVRADVPVATFTLLHEDMSTGDRELPAQLAAIAGVPHSMVAPGDIRPDRAEAYTTHTGGAVVERDWLFMAAGQYDFLDPHDVVLRAGAFEVGAWAHMRQFDGPAGPTPPPAEIIARTLCAVPEPSTLQPLQRWIDWTATHPLDIDWRIRLYAENRVGGWCAAVEQSLDLLPAASVQLANDAVLWGRCLRLPVEARVVKAHHTALVERWLPTAAALPANPSDPLALRLRRTGRRVSRRLAGARGT